MGKIESSVLWGLLLILPYYLKILKFPTDNDELLAPGADHSHCPVLGTPLWKELILF